MKSNYISAKMHVKNRQNGHLSQSPFLNLCFAKQSTLDFMKDQILELVGLKSCDFTKKGFKRDAFII